MKNIPSVDLSDFLSNDLKRKNKFIKEIGEAYEEIMEAGCDDFVSKPISSERLNSVLDNYLRFKFPVS